MIKSIMKYSPKQLEMLVQGIKEFSISLVGDHILYSRYTN